MLKKLQESNPSSSPSQNSPTVMSSLSPLADAMVELSQRQGFTPVIVTPMVVTLEPVFFVELSKALLSRIEQDLRFDWNRQVSTGLPIFGDYWASRHARKVNRQLTRHISTGTLTASMQITALIKTIVHVPILWYLKDRRPPRKNPLLLHPTICISIDINLQNVCVMLVEQFL